MIHLFVKKCFSKVFYENLMIESVVNTLIVYSIMKSQYFHSILNIVNHSTLK